MQSSQTAAPSLSRGTVQTERLVTLEDLGVCLESQLTLSLIPGPANHERHVQQRHMYICSTAETSSLQ